MGEVPLYTANPESGGARGSETAGGRKRLAPDLPGLRHHLPGLKSGRPLKWPPPRTCPGIDFRGRGGGGGAARQCGRGCKAKRCQRVKGCQLLADCQLLESERRLGLGVILGEAFQ